MRNYPRLQIEPFGRQLLSSGDLDPIYIALRRALQAGDFSLFQVYRWMIAYWCYYDAAVASFLSKHEGGDFWDWMMIAARNDQSIPIGGRWPRGHERRHFRAQIAINSVTDLRNRYGEHPENMVIAIASPSWEVRGGELCVEPIPFKVLSHRVKVHNGFGSWIAWKVADMVDRVLGVEVDFSEANIFMYRDPEKAALMLFEQRNPQPKGAKIKKHVVLPKIVEYLLGEFSGFRAPPSYNGPVTIQEVETILCKWKSHVNGHYPLFNDIREINSGLKPWLGYCEAASIFHRHMPKES